MVSPTQVTRDIAGNNTDIVVLPYADRVLVLVTQLGKVGNLVSPFHPCIVDLSEHLTMSIRYKPLYPRQHRYNPRQNPAPIIPMLLHFPHHLLEFKSPDCSEARRPTTSTRSIISMPRRLLRSYGRQREGGLWRVHDAT